MERPKKCEVCGRDKKPISMMCVDCNIKVAHLAPTIGRKEAKDFLRRNPDWKPKSWNHEEPYIPDLKIS